MTQIQRVKRVVPFCVFLSQTLLAVSAMEGTHTHLCHAPLLLRRRQTALLLHDHTEPTPEIITLLAALRKERFLFLSTQDGRLRRELDIAVRLGGARKDGLNGGDGWRKRVRRRGNRHAGRRHARRAGVVHVVDKHERTRVGWRRLTSNGRRGGARGRRARDIQRSDRGGVARTRCSEGYRLLLLLLLWGKRLHGTVAVVERVVLIVLVVAVHHAAAKCAHTGVALGLVQILVVPVGRQPSVVADGMGTHMLYAELLVFGSSGAG